MSLSTADNQPPRLRTDLRSIVVAGKQRVDRIVIDEISGRFTKVSDHIWHRLQHGTADDQCWREARAAGWTRHRKGLASTGFNPLAVKIPLGSIDWMAKRLVRFSGLVFSSTAVTVWTTFVLVAFVLTLARREQWVASIGSLPLFLQQASPVLIVSTFVLTKFVHELSHAVMCRSDCSSSSRSDGSVINSTPGGCARR